MAVTKHERRLERERLRRLESELERTRRRADALDAETRMWKHASSKQRDYRSRCLALLVARRVHAEKLRRILHALEADASGLARASALGALRGVVEALSATSNLDSNCETASETLVFPAHGKSRSAMRSLPFSGEYAIRVMRLREEPLRRREYYDSHWFSVTTQAPYSTELSAPSEEESSPLRHASLSGSQSTPCESPSAATDSPSSDEEEFECDTSLLKAAPPVPDSALLEHPLADDVFLAVSM